MDLFSQTVFSILAVVCPCHLTSNECRTQDVTLKCPPSLLPWTWGSGRPYLRRVRVSFSFGMTVRVDPMPLPRRGRVQTVKGGWKNRNGGRRTRGRRLFRKSSDPKYDLSQLPPHFWSSFDSPSSSYRQELKNTYCGSDICYPSSQLVRRDTRSSPPCRRDPGRVSESVRLYRLLGDPGPTGVTGEDPRRQKKKNQTYRWEGVSPQGRLLFTVLDVHVNSVSGVPDS